MVRTWGIYRFQRRRADGSTLVEDRKAEDSSSDGAYAKWMASRCRSGGGGGIIVLGALAAVVVVVEAVTIPLGVPIVDTIEY